jgi:predicted DNA binding protein
MGLESSAMKALELRLVQSEDGTHPMHEFIMNHSEYSSTQLLQWNPQVDSPTVFLFHINGPREPFLSELANIETAEVVEPSPAMTTDGFYLYVQEEANEGAKELVGAFAGEDIVIIPPVVYDADGSIRITVVGVDAAVQRTVDRLPDSVDVSVLHIWSGANRAVHRGTGITDRQREVVIAAVESGYYQEPRGATVADVAASLGCAPSTAAEHLRKAESKLMRQEISSPIVD